MAKPHTSKTIARLNMRVNGATSVFWRTNLVLLLAVYTFRPCSSKAPHIVADADPHDRTIKGLDLCEPGLAQTEAVFFRCLSVNLKYTPSQVIVFSFCNSDYSPINCLSTYVQTIQKTIDVSITFPAVNASDNWNYFWHRDVFSSYNHILARTQT